MAWALNRPRGLAPRAVGRRNSPVADRRSVPRHISSDEERAAIWWAAWRKSWRRIASQYWADNWPKD